MSATNPRKLTQVARGKLEFQPFLFWKFNRFFRGYLKYYFVFFAKALKVYHLGEWHFSAFIFVPFAWSFCLSTNLVVLCDGSRSDSYSKHPNVAK